MSCIRGRRSHNSKDYSKEEESRRRSIDVGDSQLTWKEVVDGEEITVEIPLTDILSLRLSDVNERGNQDESILTISYIKSLLNSQMVNAEQTFRGKTREMSTHHEQIKHKMEGVLSSRPRKLLVFKNPFSGTGDALSIFASLRPIFEEAGIICDDYATTKVKDAEERIQKFDLSQYDGVVIVGGDGLLSEVVNGLLRYTQNKVGVNLNDHSLEHSPSNIPIGIIPAGTGNMYAKMFLKVTEPTTAALHIIRGFRKSSNLYSIHQDDKLCAYSILMFGFGFSGDLIKSSQSKKYLGRLKYIFATLHSIIRQHDDYKMKLSFQEVQSPEQEDTTQYSENGLKTVEGDFHSIEGFSMNFKKTENALSHTSGENFGQYILIKKCSKLEHLSFYSLLNGLKANAFDLAYIDIVNAKVCRIELLDADLLNRRNMYINYDGELLPITSNIVNIRLHHQIASFFGS